MAEFIKPPPLDIKCTSTDCENDLHCFKQLKRMEADQRGKCRACGADLIDWSRRAARNSDLLPDLPGVLAPHSQGTATDCGRTGLFRESHRPLP